MERALTWWSPPYPDMPAVTPAGIDATGTATPPTSCWAFESEDGQPGLMLLWAEGGSTQIGLFAGFSEFRAQQQARAVTAWRAVDPNCVDLDEGDGSHFRYVAPPIPRDLPARILAWSKLPESESNLWEAASTLAMQIHMKAFQMQVPDHDYIHPPGSYERIVEANEHLSTPKLAPFAQPIPWRMAALTSEGLRGMVDRGETPKGYHL